jgi:hypothetical protein
MALRFSIAFDVFFSRGEYTGQIVGIYNEAKVQEINPYSYFFTQKNQLYTILNFLLMSKRIQSNSYNVS